MRPENQLPRFFDKLRSGNPVAIVAYGDSISEVGRTPDWHGGASAADRNWVQMLGGLLRERYPTSEILVKNFGIGGQNTYEALGRLDWLASLNPDLVLVEFGANDCAWHEMPPYCTETAMRQLLGGITAATGADTVVLGLAGENPIGGVFAHQDETGEAIAAAARESGALYVDLRAAVLAATDNGERWQDFHNGPVDCHPSDRGHRLWAETVARRVIECETTE